MAQTMTVSTKKFEEILTRLDQLTREVHTIKVKLFESEPPYGSEISSIGMHDEGLGKK